MTRTKMPATLLRDASELCEDLRIRSHEMIGFRCCARESSLHVTIDCFRRLLLKHGGLNALRTERHEDSMFCYIQIRSVQIVTVLLAEQVEQLRLSMFAAQTFIAGATPAIMHAPGRQLLLTAKD